MAFKSFLVPLKQGFLRLFVVLVLYPILLACSEPQSDEQLIRTALDKMSQAVKVKQRQDLLAYLSHDFRGQQRMSKADINGLIFYHFRRNQQLVIVLSGVTVEVKVGQAMVSAYLLLSGTNATLPERGRLLLVESNWRKEQDQWRVITANWQDVVGEQRLP